MTSPFVPCPFSYNDAPSGGVVMPTIIAARDPGNSDKYDVGYQWINTANDSYWVLTGFSGGVPNWSSGGNNPATTTDYGVVKLTDNSEPVATKAYADALVVAGAPVATTTTSGIGKLVSDANAVARIASSGVQAYFVQPSNLTAVMSSPGPIGNTVASTGAFTGLSTDGTAAISLACTGASNITCATGDLTIADTASSVIISAGEAVDDAIQLTAAAGGLVGSFAKSAVIASTEANADSVQLTSAGGMQLTATGAAGKDIVLTCTSGSMNFTAGENVADSMVFTNKGFEVLTTGAATQDITLSNTGGSITLVATENAAQNIYLHANGGASETIELRADQGTGDASVALTSDVGGITLTTGKDGAACMYLHANGGTSETIKIHSDQGTAANSLDLVSDVGGCTVTTGLNNANSIYLHANAGTSETINIRSDQGTGTASVGLLSDVGGITLNAGLAAANSITLEANSAGGGGIDVNVGSAGMTIDTTGALSLDAAGASNFSTSSGDLSLIASTNSVVITGAEAAVDAVQVNASNAAGGIDINAGTGGITVDSTGAISIDAAGASNFSTSSGDLSLIASTNSVVITGAEAAVDAVQINASNAAGGIDINAGTGGITVDTTDAISLDSVAASNFTVTGAADLTLQSTAGAVNVISGEANADSINVTSAGGMNIVATGAAAKDVILTCTSGSMTLTAGENVTDAMNITASGAASRVNISAGTGSIKLNSGLIVPVASKANADTPYTVLGTDYFIACDTSAGVLQVTLPAATAVAGRTYVIRDVGGAAAVNNITINGGGTNLVGGGAAAATKVLSAAYSGATVYSNGTVWAYSYVA